MDFFLFKVFNVNDNFTDRNGPEWWRIRSEFQKGLSSPSNVRSFLPEIDDITVNFVNKLEETEVGGVVPDFLATLSRLNLERQSDIRNELTKNNFHATVSSSDLSVCVRCAYEQFLRN